MDNFTIHDTKLAYINTANITWEMRFNDTYPHYKIFREMLDFLGQKGFYVCYDKQTKKEYPILSKDHFEGGFGNLRFKARRYPAGFEITFYQDIVHENPHGGYYDFGKFKKMPYLIKLRFIWTVNHLKEFLTTYAEAERKAELHNSIDEVKYDYVKSWHHPQTDMNFDLSELDGTTCEMNYNNIDKNGKTIYNGDIKYFYDYSGNLAKGKVYHNINNMWWVIVNKNTLLNIANFELFDWEPELPHRSKKISLAGKKYREKMKFLQENYSDKEIYRELKRRKN